TQYFREPRHPHTTATRSPVRSRVQHQKRAVVVCLVEHNPLAARYLLGLLRDDPDIEVLAEHNVVSSSAHSASTPVFAIDIDTLSLSLAHYLTVLRSRLPDAKTLFLGKEASADELRRIMFLGIQGFVSYDEVEDRLCSALRAISQGDT